MTEQSNAPPAISTEQITQEQMTWLTRGLLACQPLADAADAAGIDDIEACCNADAGLAKYVRTVAARGRLLVIETMAEKRGAFLLAGSDPKTWAPRLARPVEDDEDPDEGLFE